MDSGTTESVLTEIGKLRYKEGLAKALTIVISHRGKCMDRDTQNLYGAILKDIQLAMELVK